MYNKYFIDSYEKHLSSKYKLYSKNIGQQCNGSWGTWGFIQTMLEKVKWIIENIDINDSNFLVFSDCDVQFFGDLEFDLSDCDILFQQDYFPTSYCAGFFICKQKQNVLDFFKLVENMFSKHSAGYFDDQVAINTLFKNGCDVVQKNMLPQNKYWTVGCYTNGVVWKGQDVECPKEIIMHHANFTFGIEDKLILLEMVKKQWIKMHS
jgi:hypothetical protein